METTPKIGDEQESTTRQLEVTVRCSVPLFKYRGYWFDVPSITIDMIEEIRSFEVRSDDILVASFPKSGTTWIQEVVWQILTHAGDVHLVGADHPLEYRFPMLEFRSEKYKTPTLEEIAKGESRPRLLKTHMPYNCIPEGFTRGLGKVIYIAREPKDVSVSSYHFYRSCVNIPIEGTFQEMADAFVDGEFMNGPWIDHVAGFWQQKSKSNVLFLTYEQLQQDGLKSVRKVADFLGVSLTEDQLTSVRQQCSFQSMSENPLTNYQSMQKGGVFQDSFMRKGVVGDWVNYFTPEKAAAFNKAFQPRLQELNIPFSLSQQKLRPNQ